MGLGFRVTGLSPRPAVNCPAFSHGFVFITGGFPKLGVPFWGPNNKDYSILGLHWGSPILGKYQVGSSNIRCDILQSVFGALIILGKPTQGLHTSSSTQHAPAQSLRPLLRYPYMYICAYPRVYIIIYAYLSYRTAKA